jgi:hypothetical protein
MTLPHELDSPEYWGDFEHRRGTGCGPGPSVQRALMAVIENDSENGTWHMHGGRPIEEVTRHERPTEENRSAGTNLR